MNKEELEKEVEEYLENEHCENVCTCDEIEECKKSIRIRCMSFNCKKELIVNFAEPREKQIAELSKHIVELQNDKGELIDRCRELEAQIEKMKRCSICKYSSNLGYCKIRCNGGECNKMDKWELAN